VALGWICCNILLGFSAWVIDVRGLSSLAIYYGVRIPRIATQICSTIMEYLCTCAYCHTLEPECFCSLATTKAIFRESRVVSTDCRSWVINSCKGEAWRSGNGEAA